MSAFYCGAFLGIADNVCRAKKEEPLTPGTPTLAPWAPRLLATLWLTACGGCADGAALAFVFPNPSPRQDGGGIADYGRASDHLSLDITNASFVQNIAIEVRAMLCSYGASSEFHRTEAQSTRPTSPSMPRTRFFNQIPPR